MSAIVVYESMYGNTRAIADGLGDARLLAVRDAAHQLPVPDLTVVGGPNHMHGIATSLIRRMAVQAAQEYRADKIEPGAAGPGLRAWLRGLSTSNGSFAAAFDRRLDKPPAMAGVAARGIARPLRHHGYAVLSIESFLVQDAEGPIEDGELERARAWDVQPAEQLAAGQTTQETSPAPS